VAEDDHSGMVNRELQHVFAVRDERALEAWTAFDRVEVDGLVLVAHDAFAELAAAAAARRDAPAPVTATAWDGTHRAAVAVSAAELVPTPYLTTLAAELARVGGV
jgi:hypothetical protein